MNDMTPHRPERPKKPNGSPPSRNTPRQLVRNVTAENYQAIGSAFIGLYGGAIIALVDGKSQGEEWTAAARQWGAWRAYFSKRKIKTTFMDARGKEGKCWTVPAGWPHEFDGDATVQDDQEAANWFMRNFRPERLDLASAAKRAATIAAYKARPPVDPKPEKFDAQTGEVPPSFIDKDRLLEGYERDMAEQRARKAKPTQGQAA